MKSAKLCVFVAVLMTGIVPAIAQTNPNEEQGLKPYDSWHGGDLDSVSMTNGGLVLHIPLASFPQRGNLDLSFTVRHSSKQWHLFVPPPGHGTTSWQPLPNTGTQIVSSVDWWMQASGVVDSPGEDWTRSVTSPDGNTHLLGGQQGTFPQYPLRSRDATGLLHLNTNTLILPNGTHYSYPMGDSTTTGKSMNFLEGVQPTSITDANGNQITVSSGGWTDTLGRVIPGYSPSSGMPVQPGVATTNLSACPAGTASAIVWNLPPPVGSTSRTFTFCYSNVAIQTQFNRLGTTEASGTWSLLTAIVEPDSTEWTFAYDSYGDVTRLGFPTGGSISYTYQVGPLNCGGVGTDMSLWVKTRTVDASDGTGPHTWNYNFVSSPRTATVTSPDGNDTVHTMNTPVSGACAEYDVQAQYFQGATSGNNILKTVQTQYTGNAINDGSVIAGNTVPTQVTVTVAGNTTSKVVNSYDLPTTDVLGDPIIIGSLLQKDEYDFSNMLVRSTVNHYLWQDNATYKTNNFVGLPVSSMTKNGSGCELAKNSSGYDETYKSITLQPSLVTTSFVAPPGAVRGNRTSSNGWLISNCVEQSAITSHVIPYDTGLAYQTYDPLGRFTQYTYASAFAGAYLTQTNLPDTQMPDSGAPIVHHIISGWYDLNSGLLTTFTDENSQPFTYQYDNMLRLTQGNHPDGGQTLFTYPNTTTVERQRLISGTTYDDYKVLFDGLGRPTQTQQTTPDCASKIKVDTVYDTAGRVASVSNPYCLTTEPTYGVTQSQYDALSRTTKTIKQDSSFTTVKYEDTPGDPSTTSLVCTTATDETGKQRQACSDALGRLVKVLEQNPGAPATFAAGSVTVSGNEQSTGGAGTSGGGTVTITGSEQSTCGVRCPPVTHDTGTVNITVNGVQKSVPYASGSTTTTIATALASAFHTDGSAPADATSSGAIITLTARATGTASNYPLSGSVSSNDPTDFTPPSFGETKSGATFTGGQNAGVSDSGSVTITVNGTNYSTTYGAGDTATSIAGRLAGTVNSGTFTYATSSGSTVNVTSKTAGGNSNYSLSSSYTYNSGAFAQPSFTTSGSGATLSGGYDASAIPNHPFITQYQYDTLGNLICVHQKGADSTADKACTDGTVSTAWRPRNFTYDSLGRLLTSYNPEAGSMTYQYDNVGNLTSKVEPKPNLIWGSTQTVTVTYAYDALNRMTDKTYSDGTQNSSYRYDYLSFLGHSFSYPVGRLVAATAANNTIESFSSYDQMGRVANTVQCNPGVTGCKAFTASYDKLGDMTSLAYPANGFTVTYGYDSAARLTTATDSSGVIYAQTPTYVAGGAIKEFTSPNFNSLKYHVDYNNRLQPTEIWTGAAQGATALFDKQYSYGTTGSNNSNIYTITNVKDATRTQTFSYDVLNRLISAQDQTHWANTYAYDAWGNMQKVPVVNVPGENLQVAGDSSNHMLNYTYDAAGNMQNDGTNRYTFDAENRIACMNPDVNWVCNVNSVSYNYDAGGRRVKKSTGTNYWYGPSGQALAETDGSGAWTNYIFFGGQRLARNISGDIKYYITDHLHSTAMLVDKAGTSAAIFDDNDMYPWGGIVPGIGKTSSTNTVKFSGTYRDGESQLDFFGARYYSNTIGRFMSPDWAATPTTVPYAKFVDPQSLNLYGYVGNTPINRIDLNGHFDDPFGTFSDGGSSNIQSSRGGLITETVTTRTVTFHLPSLDGSTPGPTITNTQTDTTIQQVGVPGSVQMSSTTHAVTVDACHAQLRYRDASFGQTHAWWWISIGGHDYSISGTGEVGIGGFFINTWVTDGTTSRKNPKDNLGNGNVAFDTRDWYGGVPSPNECSTVGGMLQRALGFPNDTFSYGTSGLTSNSVAHYVGSGYDNYLNSPPRSAGWDSSFPLP